MHLPMTVPFPLCAGKLLINIGTQGMQENFFVNNKSLEEVNNA